jgi:CheY-like chemotaxis protein
MLRRLIGEDVELLTVLAPTVHTVHADAGQIEQVLMNLMVNARDAMPEGGRISIETANVWLSADYAQHHAGVAPGEYAMLAVSDTGSGMTPEVVARVFEPFFTTKEAGRGTGLGLSTVYGIVKQFGGDVWVYSEPGHGTIFKIYLPRYVDDGYVAETPAPRPAPEGGQETVLLVEDDARLRHLAERVLRESGYVVLAADDGATALAAAAAHDGPIHLVLSDVVMPGMSGRALSERLTLERPAVRTLFMSGYTDDDVMRRGIFDRQTAFLEKPFTPEQLLAKVSEVLRAK